MVTMSDEPTLSLVECEAKARATFNLLQDVRIHGGIRMIQKLSTALHQQVSIETAKNIERAAKRADLSRGAFYVERGTFYGISLYRTDLGYRFAYLTMGKVQRVA
jgi:hypothetical protein